MLRQFFGRLHRLNISQRKSKSCRKCKVDQRFVDNVLLKAVQFTKTGRFSMSTVCFVNVAESARQLLSQWNSSTQQYFRGNIRSRSLLWIGIIGVFAMPIVNASKFSSYVHLSRRSQKAAWCAKLRKPYQVLQQWRRFQRSVYNRMTIYLRRGRLFRWK